MEENKKRNGIHTILQSILLFTVSVLIMAGAGALQWHDRTTAVSNTVFMALGMGTLVFLTAFCREHDSYDYDNGENFGRFLIIWFGSLLLAVGAAYLPVSGWPFTVIFVGLALFSNMAVGMTAGTLLLAMTVLLSGQGVAAFMLYFLCGVAGMCLFGKLDEHYKIGIPLFVLVLLMIVGQTAGVVLYTNEKLRPELFMVPLLNVMVSTILLIVLLKIFSGLVIYRYRDKYLVINDQEFPLLAEWKSTSREEYYRAVHTAYFCDRIAKKLHLDADAAKAAGYYHGLRRGQGETPWQQAEQVCREYDFPPAVRKILREYLDQDMAYTEKETAVLCFSDGVISAVLYLFAKQPDTEPDYDQLVDAVFRKKLESGALKGSSITLQEISTMKNIFKEEKLYYDFLR